jgi:hypothetical protein
MVATDHLLCPLNDFILENVKALLKGVQSHGDLGFLLSELRVLANLRLDLTLDVTLNLTEIVLSDVELRAKFKLDGVLKVIRDFNGAASLSSIKVVGDGTIPTIGQLPPVEV